MKIEERFNRVLAGLSHTGYTTEIEKCEARIFIEELYKQNQKYKEVIDKLNELTNIRLLTMYFEDGGEISVLPYEDILDILKEVE